MKHDYQVRTCSAAGGHKRLVEKELRTALSHNVHCAVH